MMSRGSRGTVEKSTKRTLAGDVQRLEGICEQLSAF